MGSLFWAIVALVGWCMLIWMTLKFISTRKKLLPLEDLQNRLLILSTSLENMQTDQRKYEAEANRRREELATQYNTIKSMHDYTLQETRRLEENLENLVLGLYKTHYSFNTSSEYDRKLQEVCERQKAFITSERAIDNKTQWTVNGSKREGDRMQKQTAKLLLKAFNGECDAAIAKVTWKNILTMEQRINNAFSSINKLGAVNDLAITKEYLQLRIDELRLVFEFEEKKKAELDEQRRIKEQMKEEEKVQREIDKIQKDAEEEEARYARALAKATEEIARSKGGELEKAQQKVAQLQTLLAQAQLNKERAKFRGQITRSGHVYIISNIGSFGDTVYKIGMTRRLEPMDRVKELGDASVPFEFDVHGMIYSDDAPGLEGEIHQYFADRRVNLINPRKEFFDISLTELNAFLKNKNLNIELTLMAEAREYCETQAIRETMLANMKTGV